LNEMKETGFSVYKERALLMGVFTPETDVSGDEPLGELEKLAETAGAVVIEKAVQKRSKVDFAYCVGKGKAKEIAELAKALRIDVIIFDKELTPAQVKNLESLTNTKVIDRTELILDIFSTHARTNQAKLQVELARLEYAYPRLKNLWEHFSRFEGGIGVRGPGEQQLELDRRLIRRRIDKLKGELRTIEKRKEAQVSKRKNFFQICLVGYTNAGKSTLMNALTDAHMRVEDKLFATLDTRTRLLKIEASRQRILLSDTVGFIRRLPHHLVASFHATLEELEQADLLIHIIDVSQDDATLEVLAVESVLTELGCHHKRQLKVFNKMDAIGDYAEYTILRKRYPDAIEISALRKQGLDELCDRIRRVVNEDRKKVRVRADAGNGKFLSFILSRGELISRSYLNSEVIMEVELEEKAIEAARRIDRSAEIKVLP